MSRYFPHLTEQDLKDIGVLLGHRRKMLAAIAERAGTAPTTLEPVAAIGPNLRTPPSAAISRSCFAI